MTVQGDQPALVTTYAYIADPTLDMGAMGLPVVVEAQDIMFLQDGQFVVVTLAADANDWEDEQNEFSIVTNSLRLQPVADTDSLMVTPTPASSQPLRLRSQAAPRQERATGVVPGTPLPQWTRDAGTRQQLWRVTSRRRRIRFNERPRRGRKLMNTQRTSTMRMRAPVDAMEQPCC